jgi:hypothetical protein
MKLQIDTKEKTIVVLEDSNIKELVKALKGMLGEDWDNYSIKNNTTIFTYYYPWYQWYPLCQPYDYTRPLPWVEYSTGTLHAELPQNIAVYNVDVQSCN